MKIPSRKQYPHEKKYSWLTILLDAYAISDQFMSDDIRTEEKRRGIKVACHKGCSECCSRPDIPMNEIEFRGISWYVTEIAKPTLQNRLKPRLVQHFKTTICPFLLDEICSIYPVRPLACRDFVVYGEACDKDEDPYLTRREDIHLPNTDMGYHVAMRLLDGDMFGFSSQTEKEQAFHAGIIVAKSTPMHEGNWQYLAKLIDFFQSQS